MSEKTLFITARFRSGSTLVWNLFRNIESCCAYYEPLHDLLLTHIKYNSTPLQSHIGIKSYWDEYMTMFDRLKELHDIEFGINRLYLDEYSRSDNLSKYIQFLISSTRGKLPVLQFNRMDFRLPWLKRQFPEAKILHVFRNPRDQWYSMIHDSTYENCFDPLLNTNYELMTWSCSLAHVFPFLFSPFIKTSYHRHYLIWRLSKIMGNRLSDLSIDFDRDILGEPEKGIEKILALAEIEFTDIGRLTGLIKKPKTEEWKDLQPETWFEDVENECDSLLKRLGLSQYLGMMPISQIIDTQRKEWKEFNENLNKTAMEAALNLFAKSRNDKLIAENELKNTNEYYMEYPLQRKKRFFRFFRRIATL